jgi:HK97 family phage major capsid protein
MYENIVNMWSRLYGPAQSRAVWLINQDIYPQLFALSWEGTSSSVPAFMPANSGLIGSPSNYGTLMGRPVIPVQACSTLGDQGDIILADMKAYLTALKADMVRSEVSIHLWFDYDVVAFRFIMRVGGQCWWSSAIAGENSSDNLGFFITLNDRT